MPRLLIQVWAIAGLATALHAQVSQSPGRAVAVTFDDLPATRFATMDDARHITDGLLRHIREVKLPAIGFVNEGKLAGGAGEQLTALLAQWLDAALDLGNHTYSHVRLADTPLDEYQRDVLRGERVIRPLMTARGRRPRYFRHPTLNTGPDLETRDAFERFLGAHGYTVAPVTIDNDEYLYALAYDHARARGDTTLMARLGRDYLRYMAETFGFYEGLSVALLGREPAQVLLLHANALNADYLGQLAAALVERGYRFVSLDEALTDPAYGIRDTYVGPRGPSSLTRWAVTRGMDAGVPPGVPVWVREAGR